MGSTTNLAAGPGELYVAPFGTTEPASTNAGLTGAPDVAWTNVGFTQGGMTMTVNQTYMAFEVDQIVETPERRVTSQELSFQTNLAEVTLANLVIALNSGTTVTGTSGAPDTFEPAAVTSADSPNYKAIIFDGIGNGGYRRRVIIRKVLSTENVEVSQAKDSMTTFPVTFTSHYVTPSIKSYKILQGKAQP